MLVHDPTGHHKPGRARALTGHGPTQPHLTEHRGPWRPNPPGPDTRTMLTKHTSNHRRNQAAPAGPAAVPDSASKGGLDKSMTQHPPPLHPARPRKNPEQESHRPPRKEMHHPTHPGEKADPQEPLTGRHSSCPPHPLTDPHPPHPQPQPVGTQPTGPTAKAATSEPVRRVGD